MGRLTDKILQLNKKESAGFSFSTNVVLFYSFALVFSVLSMGIGEEARSSAWFFFLSYLIPSVVIFLSLCIFFKTTRFNSSDFFSVGFRPVLIAPIVLIFAGAFLSFSEANEIFVKLLSRFGYVDKTQSLPEYSVLNFILCIIVVGILPPILEETLFRGVILGAFKGSPLSAVLISALCFSIYHMSPSRTIYQFIIGVLFALVAIRSGSVIPTMIIHALNNVTVLVIQYFFPLQTLSPTIKTILFIAGALCLFIGIVLLFFLTKKDGENNKKVDNGRIGGFFAWGSVGIALCAIMWAARLFQ